MSFPRYPEYRDSGIEWIGELPSHWTLPPLSARFTSELGKMLDEKRIEGKHLVPYLRNVDVQWDRINVDDLPQMDIAPHEHDRYLLAPDDLLVCEGGEVGRAAEWRGQLSQCGFQKALHRLRPLTAEQHSRFLYFTLRAASDRGVFEANGNPNTILHLTGQQIRSYRFPNPPASEQKAIAAFLDRETAKIDALVAEQQRLMDLLQEKRHAFISHAVTKGLNPDAPMKPSGVEWIGDVPAHWTCHRNKAIFNEVDDRSVDAEGELLTVSHITGVTRRADKDVSMFMAETLEGYKRCSCGDLVINTMWAWMGALGCAPLDGLVSPSYNVYRVADPLSLLPEYYDFLCRIPSHRVAMKANSTGVWESRLRLYPDAFLSMRVALPPFQEQRAIFEFLKEQASRYDALASEAQRAIDVLLERRAALISAAVTGQIDVRSVTASAA